MELKGKHVAVLAEDLYEDLELWYPVYRFREAGAKVTIVGGGASGYSSKHGYPVTPDATAEKVNAADFDAVIIPGGYAPDLWFIETWKDTSTELSDKRCVPCRGGVPVKFPSSSPNGRHHPKQRFQSETVLSLPTIPLCINPRNLQPDRVPKN